MEAFGGVSDDPFIEATKVRVSAKHLAPAPHTRSRVPIARAVFILNISTSLQLPTSLQIVGSSRMLVVTVLSIKTIVAACL
jgi:hypothetical protein